MRYSKETEQVEVLKITFNKKQAENIRRDISNLISFYGKASSGAKQLQAMLSEWLDGGL